jgi:ribosomal protein S18 acetylase RimI-like enzyme
MVNMDEEYRIVSIDKPGDAEWKGIGGGLQNYNIQQTGDDKFKHVCFVIYAPNQEIAGGLIGEIYWGWCFIHLLWVKEDLRGRGYGHRLLTMAEEEARQHGAKNIYLDTFSFQAPAFYRQHGYRVFGELKDFPPGHQRYFLTKQL